MPFIFYLALSCSNPFANQQLAMTADPGVTEAWISLHVDGVKSGADYIVQRDGATVFKGRLQSPDTVVYDSLLQPATGYAGRQIQNFLLNMDQVICFPIEWTMKVEQ